MTRKDATIYLCDSCGNEFSVWAGKCPMCGEWNTLKELRIKGLESGKSRKTVVAAQVEKLNDIDITKTDRLSTGISEFDRVLGGGVVGGSLILIGGEPGIGKSTIILQVANNVDHTLYVSAEESAGQIKLRADRLSIDGVGITLSSEANLESILQEARKLSPNLLIIDSIQTVYSNSYDATPGSLVQVRECGIILQQFAKSTNISIIIIGHVTKEGNLAGPKILEHLVDVVLYLEGEKFNDARILRGIKNRFGATNEVGIFSMQTAGMIEVTNPSEMFLAQRENSPGSVITITLEGTRPILVEIQALVVPTHFGYSKRTSSGFDLNRLNLLAAVISKKTNINLSNYDIYLNIIGGIKLGEPAVDLAVCAAIISSYKNKPLPTNYCFFGEVGLLGEIRNVLRKNDREKEAKALGYEPAPKIANVSDILGLLRS